MKRLLVLLCLVPACGQHETPTKTAATAPAPKARESYPFPECAAVVDYLKTNTGDPASVEVIEWEGTYKPYERIAIYDKKKFVGYGDKDQVRGDIVALMAKYRAKNEFGALSVYRKTFEVDKGKVVSAYDTKR